MKQMSDEKIIEMMCRCFIPTKRYYHKYGSYILKHVLEQVDGRYYVPESEFIRLMDEARFKSKPTSGQSVRLKVWVSIDKRVDKKLWGMGNNVKLMDLEI